MCMGRSKGIPGCVDVTVRKKRCGNCDYFMKWKNDPIGGGLCEFTDARTHPDTKADCKHWKGIRYKRERNYNLIIWEMIQMEQL